MTNSATSTVNRTVNRTGNCNTQTDFENELMFRLWQSLPLVDFGDGMQLVVEAWWQLLDAEAVLLIVPDPGEKYLWASYFGASRSFSDFGETVPLEPGWPENLLPVVQQKWGDLFSVEPEQERFTVPLRSTGPVRGILTASLSNRNEFPELSCAAGLTSRFLDQVRLAAHQASQTQLQELKLQSLAEFAAGAGHEINNPLAAISGRAQMLLKNEKDPERRQSLATIGAQALRIRDMIGDLMLFGRPPQPKLESVSLPEVVDTVCLKLNETSERVKFSESPLVNVIADPVQLALALQALLENSLQSSEASQQVTIGWKQAFDGYVQIEISDSGSGLSGLDLSHLFDPFYSGRQAGRGLGFGLPKVWQIARQHQATIALHPRSGAGTRALLHWPVAREA